MSIERIELLTPDLFLDEPAEFLVKQTVLQLLQVPQFVELFGERIDPYDRTDYSIRELPAIRFYNLGFTKDFDSWFVDGECKLDIILPASLKRETLQFVSDTLSGVMIQQFRRPTFFATMRTLVPGLNEFGKRVTSRKDLMFDLSGDLMPLTQITVNFRIDLREWDDYMTASGRTKDDPFEVSLGKLKRIVTEIQGLLDDNSVDPVLTLDQKVL